MNLPEERQHFLTHYQGGGDHEETMQVSFDAGVKITKEAILSILRENSPCCSCCNGSEEYADLLKKIEALA